MSDRLPDQFSPERITATEIEQARGSLTPAQFQHCFGEIRFTFHLSDEGVQRLREAFGGVQRALEQIPLETLEQVGESLSRGFEAIAQSRFREAPHQQNPYNPLNRMYICSPPRYAKRELMAKTWCEQNGYTDLFYQEWEWWAFPPNGVMPVQVAKVMGQERSPF